MKRHEPDEPPVAEATAGQPGEPEKSPEPEVRRYWALESAPRSLLERGQVVQHEGRPRAFYASGYARTLSVLYIEQGFRWEARALNDNLRHDTGLRYQGFFCDAEDGWTQPVSVWAPDKADMPDALRNPLQKDGEAIRHLRDFRAQEYDVVILGDLRPDNPYLPEDFWKWMQLFVLHGGRVVLLPGQGHHPGGYLDIEEYVELCPVVLDASTETEVDTTKLKFHGLTPAGEEHEIFNLGETEKRDAELWGRETNGAYQPGELHGFYWYQPAGAPKEGATVLARVVGEGGRIADGAPLVVAREYGRGRVLWLGTDEHWLWRKFVGDYYFYSFYRNAVRWTAGDPGPGGEG